MGFFLNSTMAYTLYKDETAKPYFVDKTEMLGELFPLISEGSNSVCITRPRRFGKTHMANLIASFLGKGCDASELFDRLLISENPEYQRHLNQYHVIHISFNEIPRRCRTYEQYIGRIEEKLMKDLKDAYPDADIQEEEAVWDALRAVHMQDASIRFVFVLDEWDYIFHRDIVTADDRKSYIEFLSNLLKGKPYVQFAYMTGILPIAKYSSGSELNMFQEYTMATKEKYGSYFGFTKEEVDELFDRYVRCTKNPKVNRDGLRIWYDGYRTQSGRHIYNPRSVVCALSDNQLGSYWTSSGPYDEMFYYIENNIADVREDLVYMAAGASISSKVQEYAAVSMRLGTRDEIYSAMVVYGFLTYENGKVFIPNKELMDKFTDMLRKEVSLGYVHRLAKASEKMLKATLHGDTGAMLEILELAHNTEVPLLKYNNETELTAIVNLVYLAARDSYRVEREDKAGKGYVDFIFYPETDLNADCIILELKVGHTPEEAIQQIKDKKYALRFRPRMGEIPKYTGRILAVGIVYDKETKKHQCAVEELSLNIGQSRK